MLKALRILYVELHFSEPDIIYDYDNDYLSEHTARSGRSVLWYKDNEREAAIYTDNCNFLTQDEIKNELI